MSFITLLPSAPCPDPDGDSKEGCLQRRRALSGVELVRSVNVDPAPREMNKGGLQGRNVGQDA